MQSLDSTDGPTPGALPRRDDRGWVPRKAGRQDTRHRNERVLLHLISDSETTSRAELSRLSGLTRATVSSLVGDMISDGLVVEVGTGEPAGGKPPTLVALNQTGRVVVVVDASSRLFRGGVLSLTSRLIVEREEGPGQLKPLDALVRFVRSLVDQAIGEFGDCVLGVGVASPGVIDADGLVVDAANLGWHNVGLGELLRAELDIPTTVINDAHAVAVAAAAGLGPDAREVLVLRLGKGLGAGLMLDGSLHLGSHRAAGEIGHTVVDEDGDTCRCGSRGCLETVASAGAIYRRSTGEEPPSSWGMDDLVGRAGPEAVRRSVGRAVSALGLVIAHLVNALDLSNVVISSLTAGLAEGMVADVEADVRSRILPSLRDHLVVTADTSPNLALVGVGSTIIRQALGLGDR